MRIGTMFMMLACAATAATAVPASSAGAQEPVQQGRGHVVAVPRSVAKAWDWFAMALESGNPKAAADVWTDDAIAVGLGGVAASGRAEIEQRLVTHFAHSKVTAFEVHPAEFHAIGTTAWEMGKLTQRFQDAGKAEQAVECWYMAIWQQQHDDWRMARLTMSCPEPK